MNVRCTALVVLFLLLLAAGVTLGEEGYAGAETCAACHDEVAGAFESTAHGRSDIEGWDGATSCEACHGAGQVHADSGDAADILNLATAEPEQVADACLGCHAGNVAAHWQGSTHEAFDVSCASCHKAHAPWTNEAALANEQITDGCLSCHKDMKKHLFQRSSHPLNEGLMSCVSCHDPHGSPAEAAIAAITPNDKCYECHADKRGPYLFEHTPVREDCQTCHDPHGSNQTMMLVTSAPRLCQSCHLFGHHQTVPGTSKQVWNQNRSCLNCHPRIHGSNHPSGVIFMR